MIWLYAVISPSGNRLALLISALRVIGILALRFLQGSSSSRMHTSKRPFRS